MTQPQASPTMRLHYFELPGRAEATRIMLAHANIPYDNVVIEPSTWPQLKQTMPFGQVPVLEVDGKMLAQSSAIERYVANLAGLMPADEWLKAKMNEVVAFVQDIGDEIRPTFSIKDPEEKIKARQDLLAGSMGTKLEKLAALLDQAGGQYFVGNCLTYADITVYAFLSSLICGFYDGIPKDLLDRYPKLKAHHNTIASLPSIAPRYENAEGMRATFKPLS